MNASNVKISAEVLASNKLTMKRKRQLRYESVYRLIESKPVGTPITIKEFSDVTFIPKSGNAHAFIAPHVA